MIELQKRNFERRGALRTIGSLGAGALTMSAGLPSRANAEWSPELAPNSEQFFVIDAVAHCYNHAPYNRRLRREAGNSINTTYSYHELCTPERFRLTYQQWERDWQADEVMDVMLLESATNMVCMHSVPMFDLYYDGLVSNDKGAYLKNKYPDRVVWYAAVDLFNQDRMYEVADEAIARGADGIKLYPTQLNVEQGKWEGWFMDDEELALPFFDYLQGKGIKHIAIHKLVGYTGDKTKALGVEDIHRAAETFPNITFHIVHAGWLLLEETVRLLNARDNVTAVLEGPMLFPLFDLDKFTRLMSMYMNRVDTNRIIYASTAVNQHPYWIVKSFIDYQPPEGADFSLTDADKAKILGGNFARYHDINMAAQRLKIADDKWSKEKAVHGFREPYLMQRLG